MTRKFGFSRLLTVSAVVVAAVITLASCSKFDNDGSSNTPVAGLMAFNLAPDKGGVGIALSGNSLTSVALNYTSYTGVYQPIFPGSRDVQAYTFNLGTAVPFASTTKNFEVNKYYSSFTMGVDSAYKNVVVEDELDSLKITGDEAYVRYVNAIPDSINAAAVTITGGDKVINESAAYGNVSNFTKLNIGAVEVKVNVGTTATATRSITLEKSKIYTILLIGVPGSADPEKAVQIKFIQNGTITP